MEAVTYLTAGGGVLKLRERQVNCCSPFVNKSKGCCWHDFLPLIQSKVALRRQMFVRIVFTGNPIKYPFTSQFAPSPSVTAEPDSGHPIRLLLLDTALSFTRRTRRTRVIPRQPTERRARDNDSAKTGRGSGVQSF